MLLYYILLVLLLLLLISVIAYMIIARRFRAGVFIENGDTADAAGMLNLELADLTAVTDTDPLVLHEHSRSRKLYGGFIITCAYKATGTVTFTAHDGTTEIGTKTCTFDSTNTDVVEVVTLKWKADKVTDAHDIKFRCSDIVQVLRVDYYYY